MWSCLEFQIAKKLAVSFQLQIASALLGLIINVVILKVLVSKILEIHVNNKQFYVWHAVNPFLYPIVFGMVLCLAHRRIPIAKKKKPINVNLRALCFVFKCFWITLSIECVYFFIILEIYYMEKCPLNDEASVASTWDIFTSNVDILNEMNANFTVFAGTLLFVLRHSDIPPWDTDTDILLQIASTPNNNPLDFVDNFKTKYKSKITMANRSITYYPTRGLVQVFDLESKAFGDIWLFQNTGHTLVNEDYTIKTQHIQTNLVFPSETVSWKGILVPIPRNSHIICEMEYGPDYMIPYYNRLQCLESIAVNFRITRTRLLVWSFCWIWYNIMIFIIVTRNFKKMWPATCCLCTNKVKGSG
eukprot:946698_1